MALKVRGLSAHSQDGYGEWGVSDSLRLAPGAAGRGLTASLTPSWGMDPGGSERLWALPDAEALVANGEAAPSSRLDAELGYGMGVFGGGFIATPHVGFGLSDTAREVRLGWRLGPAGGGASGSISTPPGAKATCRSTGSASAPARAGERQANSVKDSRRKSGRRKGVTNRLHREPCAGRREASGEVSVAARAGRANERRNARDSECRGSISCRRQHRAPGIVRAQGLRGV